MSFVSIFRNIEIIEHTVGADNELCAARRERYGSPDMLYSADVQLQNRFKAAVGLSYRNVIMLVLAGINGNSALAVCYCDIRSQLCVKITLADTNKCGWIHIFKGDVRACEDDIISRKIVIFHMRVT